MAVKDRPGSAREAMGQQEARTRRGAPGKRFVGQAAEQSAKAREDERRKVERLAERDAARRRAEELDVPISTLLAELAWDVARLGWTVAVAPLRLAAALRRPRTA